MIRLGFGLRLCEGLGYRGPCLAAQFETRDGVLILSTRRYAGVT